MAGGSPFFARIKRDTLTVISAVPAGRLVTFKDVGVWLDVAPRHVAYILARLDPDEQARTPWHRAVPEGGSLVTPKASAFGIPQRDLLALDGVPVTPDGRILELGQRLIAIGELPIDLPPQIRPPDAPQARSRASAARRR